MNIFSLFHSRKVLVDSSNKKELKEQGFPLTNNTIKPSSDTRNLEFKRWESAHKDDGIRVPNCHPYGRYNIH